MMTTVRCFMVVWIITIVFSVFALFLIKIYIDSYKLFIFNQTTTLMSELGQNQSGFIRKTQANYHKVADVIQNQTNKPPIKYIHYYHKPKFIPLTSFNKCEYQCRMTSSKLSSEFDKSDAVIFFGPRLGRKMSPPKKRKDQIWILHSKESPANFFGALPKWKNLFNWTMAFRRDSDILAINGIFSKRTKFPNNLHSIVFSSKSKSSAWFVSNCRTHGKRETFVKKLSSTSYKVDIYGGCGLFRCPRRSENACMNILRKKYKFYLSFENSLCYDYITEKSFKIYESLVDAIPVVRGVSSQYPIYLPPNSYINVEKFANVRELSIFMKKIETNKTLFESFFKWKPHYEAYWPFPVEFCELCRRVHHAEKYKRLISDVGKWITLKDYKEACRLPKDV